MSGVVRKSTVALGLTVWFRSGSIAVPGQQPPPTQPRSDSPRQVAGTQHQADQEKEYERHPTLAIDARAPDFNLPGVDGDKHQLGEYSKYPVLAIIFTCDNCPTANPTPLGP